MVVHLLILLQCSMAMALNILQCLAPWMTLGRFPMGFAGTPVANLINILRS